MTKNIWIITMMMGFGSVSINADVVDVIGLGLAEIGFQHGVDGNVKK